MAESVMRNPVPDPVRGPGAEEPARRRGPEAVRAAQHRQSVKSSERAEHTGPRAIDPGHELPATGAHEGPAGTRSHAASTSAPRTPTVQPAAATPTTASVARASRTHTPPRGSHTPTAAQEMLRELRTRLEEMHGRLEELRVRVEKQTAAAGLSLKHELSQDADYVKTRARLYHEQRPLQAMGMIAATTFVLGLFLGFWRR